MSGTEEQYMRRAIELARKGEGHVNPNPLVGAVLVREGRIIGEGYHAVYGDLHAERNAIKNATEDPAGSTLYVTLEPCCHHGKQPPCTEAIIAAGISRVVIGSRDPNPLVSGKGTAQLRAAGIEVTEDFLREECDALNPIFFHFITTGMPYVVFKYAMTADGKIATRTGDSRWVSGELSRQDSQHLRNRCSSLMAGIGTVLADDPLLTCRIPGGRNPLRIICDSHLRLPLNSRIARTAGEVPTLVAGAFDETDEEVQERKAALEQLGIEVLNFPDSDLHVDIAALCRELGRRKLDSVLLEGGGILGESALRAGVVQELRLYLAPKIFGGQARSPVEGIGVSLAREALPLTLTDVTRIGEDLRLTYQVRGWGREKNSTEEDEEPEI